MLAGRKYLQSSNKTYLPIPYRLTHAFSAYPSSPPLHPLNVPKKCHIKNDTAINTDAAL
jgi:hypothetical protein